MSLRDRDYLDHIVVAIGKIQRYTAPLNESAFLANEQVQDAGIRNLEIIGEAVTKLSPAFKAEAHTIPWRDIANMRNRLIHGYMSVNTIIVWDTVQKVLPGFLRQITELQLRPG